MDQRSETRGRRAKRESGPAAAPREERVRRGTRGEPGETGPQRWTADDVAAWLPAPDESSDKYRRGVLGVRTGSAAYPGAAVLGVAAAWRTGVGLLRYSSPLDDEASESGLPSPSAAVLAARPETVFGPGPIDGSGASDAWLIGSGTDPERRSDREEEMLRQLLAGDAPVVVDAGALPLAVEVMETRAPAILTPHRGEFLRLWQAAGLGRRPQGWPSSARRDRTPPHEALAQATARLSAVLGATVLLKGSTSVIATPQGQTLLCGPATPWLATAGTGDVLGGILGALVASHAVGVREDSEALGALGATAAVLHDLAARRAAGNEAADPVEDATAEPAGGPITAMDVVDALPATIAALRARRPHRQAHRSL